MFGFLSYLYERPLLRIILSALILTTTFITFAVMELDIGFVPVLDKANLFGVMAFYCSILTVIISITRLLIEYLLRFNDFMLEEFPIFVFSDSFSKLFRKLYRILYAILLAAGFAFAVGAGAIEAVRFISNYESGYILIGALAVFILMSILYLIMLTYRSVQKPWRVAFIASLMNLSAIIAVGSAGSLYVQLMRDVGPRLRVEFVGGRGSKQASFVFPANNGYIVFYAGSKQAYYLPYAEIRALISQKREDNRSPLLFPYLLEVFR